MKKQNLFKLLAIGAAIMVSSNLKAQVADNGYREIPERQKINVDLRITPSVKEFKAGITPVENYSNKIRVWICNGDEKKCTISISCSEGLVWSASSKDVYYSQVFDLSSLDDGNYIIRIDNGRENFEKNISISTNSYVQRSFKLQ